MVYLQDRLHALWQSEVGEYRTIDYLSPRYQSDLQQLTCTSTTATATATEQTLSSSSSSQSPEPTSSSPPVVVDPGYETGLDLDDTADVTTTHGATAVAAAAPLSSSSSALSSSSSSTGFISELWREKICEWSYQVIDHFNFSRDVAAVSIHYLDRYLARVRVSKSTFQLAAMTCLYLAIKMYEPNTITMATMIELSRGYFTTDQMAAMELSILRTLSWRVHPPTSHCFSKHIMALFPSSCVSMEERYEINELARFLLELSVIDYYFVAHQPSDVALSAIMNAIEEVCTPAGTALPTLAAFASELSQLGFDETFLNPHKHQIIECRSRLQILYRQGGYSTRDNDTATNNLTAGGDDGIVDQSSSSSSSVDGSETRQETISPVSVSYGLEQIYQQQQQQLREEARTAYQSQHVIDIASSNDNDNDAGHNNIAADVGDDDGVDTDATANHYPTDGVHQTIHYAVVNEQPQDNDDKMDVVVIPCSSSATEHNCDMKTNIPANSANDDNNVVDHCDHYDPMEEEMAVA